MASRKWGKKIDVWELYKGPKVYQFELRMGMTESFYRTVFRAMCEPLEIEVEDADVNALKKKAQKELDEITLYDFQPKLFVKFRTKDDFWRASPDAWKEFDIEAKDEDGTYALVDLRGRIEMDIERALVAETGGKPDHLGRPERLQMAQKGGQVQSCSFYSGVGSDGTCRLELEDNQINRDALQKIVNAMAALGDKMTELLNPDGIEKRLKAIAINGQKLLPEKTEE